MCLLALNQSILSFSWGSAIRPSRNHRLLKLPQALTAWGSGYLQTFNAVAWASIAGLFVHAVLMSVNPASCLLGCEPGCCYFVPVDARGS